MTTFLIIIALVLAFVLAIRRIIKKKLVSRCSGCSGDCSCCSSMQAIKDAKDSIKENK